MYIYIHTHTHTHTHTHVNIHVYFPPFKIPQNDKLLLYNISGALSCISLTSTAT